MKRRPQDFQDESIKWMTEFIESKRNPTHAKEKEQKGEKETHPAPKRTKIDNNPSYNSVSVKIDNSSFNSPMIKYPKEEGEEQNQKVILQKKLVQQIDCVLKASGHHPKTTMRYEKTIFIKLTYKSTQDTLHESINSNPKQDTRSSHSG